MVVETKYFTLGDEHSAQEWASIVATLAQGMRAGEQTVEQTYLDTFDWALCHQDACLVFEKGKEQSLHLFCDGKAPKFPASLPVEAMPVWPADVPAGKMQKFLTKQAPLRSFIALTQVKSEQIFVRVEDKKGRERVRLIVEVNFQRTAPRRKMVELGCRLRIECIAGYERDFAKTLPFFAGLQKSSQMAFFDSLMQNVNKTPKDYSSKMKLSLERDMRADVACKEILLNQLNQIERNIDGTLADIDSEFLHDLRVAVRRSRSALSRLKGVLPQTVQDKYAQELAWIGSITTPVRDLDVYLLDYPKYRDQLRTDLQSDLSALYDYLTAHHKSARELLVTDLKSRRFKDFLTKWRTFLKRPVPVRPTAPAAAFPIGDLADKRIWKTYRRVINEGSVIGDETPAEALHDLRKTCKKLRYLLEFFASLYPAKDVGALIKTLKGLQENLGDFQDLDVQADTLHGYSEGMLKEGVSDPKVFLAMGVLVENFMTRKVEVRAEFSERFADFSSKAVEKEFRKLVGREKRKVVTASVSEEES
ncbi:CHAD domain-containing protein [Terasakiella sp. A23]|uniref:CHAD domain-containing protein n=1 Tax=Terasakiella sp. FCG-A23 TaxID=3080561 RepID=UPI0029537405|nr:CHAD domain-containing protein [Terasakiella sp. A23]MDV7339715.1 CHAD domain-containing protein [Terasakiella sp. A23]